MCRRRPSDSHSVATPDQLDIETVFDAASIFSSVTFDRSIALSSGCGDLACTRADTPERPKSITLFPFKADLSPALQPPLEGVRRNLSVKKLDTMTDRVADCKHTPCDITCSARCTAAAMQRSELGGTRHHEMQRRKMAS